jgi:hypothetical protein
MKAAISQGQSSLEYITKDYDLKFANEDIIEKLEEIFNKEIEKSKVTFEILKFKPKEHPVVKSVIRVYKEVFSIFYEDDDVFMKFKVHYNDNIEDSIRKEFGNFYEEHIQEVEKNWFKDNELKLLEDTINLSRIGFAEHENIEYETTYAKWSQITEYNKKVYETDESEYSPIQELIDEYFPKNEISLDKILFIISDFGKGKSVFLRHYASELAKKYLKNREGKIPVYINLREYSNYKDDTIYGVIGNYLANKYRIDIGVDYYKFKEYVFLLDGLDESGELNPEHINKVIERVRKIRMLDQISCRKNQIIIASRPINDGLKIHLESYNPKRYIEEGKNPTSMYITLLGFKMEQVNTYLRKNLMKYTTGNTELTTEAKRTVDEIIVGETNCAKKLIDKRLISQDELRRPIFSYMIVYLLTNNIDIYNYGQIGIYISFINLLTKEAKFVNDQCVSVNLKMEYGYRNILHAVSALWMNDKSLNKQGHMNKADICRVIKGKNIDADDKVVLEQNDTVNNVKFLSHSYFGENENTIHFQHQSFAELLVAEYYLKAIIKFSLDTNSDIEELALRLSIGDPTDQTMIFLIDLLALLKESSTNSSEVELLRKRRILAPLISSLGISNFNNMYSYDIDYRWNKKYLEEDNIRELSENALRDWPIKETEIDKITDTMYKLFECESTFLFARGNLMSSLFNNEVINVKKFTRNSNLCIEKWCALLVGNILYNNVVEKKFFNSKIHYKKLFSLLEIRLMTHNGSTPTWAQGLFNGIVANGNSTNDIYEQDIFILYCEDIRNMDLSNLDFSYSVFSNIAFEWCQFTYTNFKNVEFKDCAFFNCYCANTKFNNIKTDNLLLHSCLCLSDVTVPIGICKVLTHGKKLFSTDFKEITYLNGIAYSDIEVELGKGRISDTLIYLIKHVQEQYLIKTDEIMGWFEFDENNIFGQETIKKILETKII